MECLQVACGSGPAGSRNRLWCGCSGEHPSLCPWRQELAYESSGGPTPHTPLNNGALFSRQTKIPLGAFPATHPLTPVPSAVSAQPTVFLSPDPFSQPYTLALSHTPPHPPSISGVLSQAVVLRADSQGGFGMGGAQAPGARTGGGHPRLRGE